MKNIFAALEKLLAQLLCSHDYQFVKWIGPITRKITDGWFSETGWLDYRCREVRCLKCEKRKKERVVIGGASYGGFPYKDIKDAYVV